LREGLREGERVANLFSLPYFKKVIIKLSRPNTKQPFTIHPTLMCIKLYKNALHLQKLYKIKVVIKDELSVSLKIKLNKLKNLDI